MAGKKTKTNFTDPRLNELANIISGIYLGQTQPGKPLNKTNSLDFIRAQLRGEVLTLDRISLSRMYMQFGLCQAIAEVPVFDAFRNEPIVRAYVRSKNAMFNPQPAVVTYKPQGLLKRLKNVFTAKSNEDEQGQATPEDEQAQIAIDKRKEWEEKAAEIDKREREERENNLATPAEPWKVKALLMAAKESRLYDALKGAAVWGRVFGGGAVIINTPDQ